jgi:hypothetical protein
VSDTRLQFQRGADTDVENAQQNTQAKVSATNRLAAVKIIKLEAGEELDDVLNEVNFLRDCQHRNVVSYVGCYMKKVTKGQKHIWVRCQN